MNVKDLRESVGSLEKFFVDPQGEFYITICIFPKF